jgi:hypothetical protein
VRIKFLAKKSFKQSGHGLRVRLGAVAVVLAASGFGVYQYDSHKVPASHAAGDSFQYCQTEYAVCLNAWNNGPWVKVYSVGQQHNLFTLIAADANGDYGISYSGGGSWSGKCIGDAYNSSTNYEASLDTCPGGSQEAGWGTNFHIDACGTGGNTGYAFHNNHWNKWLAPATGSNGITSNGYNFILNAQSPFCFGQFNPGVPSTVD